MLSLLLTLQRPEPVLEAIKRPDLAPIYVFRAKDDRGYGLDCLKVEQAAKDLYLGVHHRPIKDGFELCLVDSKDLKVWKHKRVISTDGHQGTLARVGARWLLAWEQSSKNGNHLRLEAYASLTNLQKGIVEKSKDIERSLSQGAEGTPTIESVNFNRSWERSVIKLGFHYYRHLDVDRQAVGTLKGLTEWTASPLSTVNKPLEPIYKGNIGDRDSAQVGAYAIALMEAQLTKGDWASWRILARVGQGAFKPLDILTPGNSTSFANPTLTYPKLARRPPRRRRDPLPTLAGELESRRGPANLRLPRSPEVKEPPLHHRFQPGRARPAELPETPQKSNCEPPSRKPPPCPT